MTPAAKAVALSAREVAQLRRALRYLDGESCPACSAGMAHELGCAIRALRYRLGDEAALLDEDWDVALLEKSRREWVDTKPVPRVRAPPQNLRVVGGDIDPLS